VRLKDNTVSLRDVSWRMFHAAIVAEAIYKQYGAELVITSANDAHTVHGGGNKKKTLHDDGLALDLRTYNLGGREAMVAAELARQLGPEFDVVLEKDHIHMEYDPT
jgi:hypothetical protein